MKQQSHFLSIFKQLNYRKTVTLILGVLFFLCFSAIDIHASFSDVPDEQTFSEFIDNIKNRGIVNGYPDGTYRPNEPVSRGALAKFVVNAFGMEQNGEIIEFSDVTQDNPFYEYVNILRSNKIINGYPDGTFRPNDFVTRGAAMKFITNSVTSRYGLFTSFSGHELFSDVALESTFAEYIDAGASIRLPDNTRIIGGYSDGRFGPDEFITRGAMAKIISQTIIYAETGGTFDPPTLDKHPICSQEYIDNLKSNIETSQAKINLLVTEQRADWDNCYLDIDANYELELTRCESELNECQASAFVCLESNINCIERVRNTFSRDRCDEIFLDPNHFRNTDIRITQSDIDFNNEGLSLCLN